MTLVEFLLEADGDATRITITESASIASPANAARRPSTRTTAADASAPARGPHVTGAR
jgi:hypothetical protein